MIKFGITSIISICKDCGWRCEDHIDGLRKAREHARTNEHVVLVEETRAGRYDGKDI